MTRTKTTQEERDARRQQYMDEHSQAFIQFPGDEDRDARDAAASKVHRDYYAWVANNLGTDSLKGIILSRFTKEQLKKALVKDPHMNNLPLHRWDAMDPEIRQLFRESIKGSGSWSLSDTVCVAKEVARQIAEGGQDEPEPQHNPHHCQA